MKVSYALIAILFVNVLADLKDDYQKEYKLEISLSNMEIHRASNHYDSNGNGLEYIITKIVETMVKVGFLTIGMMSYGLTTVLTIPEHININDPSMLKDQIVEQRFLRKKIYNLIGGPVSEGLNQSIPARVVRIYHDFDDTNQMDPASEDPNQSGPVSEGLNQMGAASEGLNQSMLDSDDTNQSGPDSEDSNQNMLDSDDTNQSGPDSEDLNQSDSSPEDPPQIFSDFDNANESNYNVIS
ncbi:uncharacterized protein LOC126835842 [Adelges cooleyi]|uniref:uncharacterized protein LOC126835842 n=1 Tax=Adelges cooleyi TaxID=133065 RepID=UPI00217F9824|nr:uncharacterized protein LOC126835842 [Adelges cooleyi]